LRVASPLRLGGLDCSVVLDETSGIAAMTPRQPPGDSNARSPVQRRVKRSELVLWGLAALCTICVAGAVAILRVEGSDRILRGVKALGVPLGGMSREQAAAVLHDEWESRRIEVIAGDVVNWHTPTELGMLLDAEAMAESAHALGRRPGHIKSILRRDPPVSVDAVWTVDEALAEARLRALASQFDRPRSDASMRLVGTTVEAVPAQAGRALHVLESAAWLREHSAEVLAERRWNLQVVSLPPVVTDVSSAVAEAQRLLAHNLTLRLYDPISDESSTTAITPDVWVPWLRVHVDAQQSDAFQWELDAAEIEASLREQMAGLDAGQTLQIPQAVEAASEAITNGSWVALLRIYHSPEQHTVQEGETIVSIGFDHGLPYPWIEQANPGVSDDLHVGQVLQIPSPDVLLPLPIVAGKRITVSLSSQMMWAYENGALKWEWPVSTGMASSPTSPGVFQVRSHDPNAYAAEWDLWMPHFMGIYEPAPGTEVMNGFHGFPSRGGVQLLWTNNLGTPVTYGCILLSSDNAALLYDWAEDGTVVVIRP
jgi:lipoprotein-anchoring transpeptidase ErfK/SrfK